MKIYGNNNHIHIGKNCRFGPNCDFFMFGNETTIIIGDRCSCTRKVEFNAQEDRMTIMVGEDCMFSNRIVVRTSDSHPIYDMNSGDRINNPKDVIIGEHVWIAPNSKIMKGAKIGNGCVVGSDTTVSKEIVLP